MDNEGWHIFGSDIKIIFWIIFSIQENKFDTKNNQQISFATLEVQASPGHKFKNFSKLYLHLKKTCDNLSYLSCSW